MQREQTIASFVYDPAMNGQALAVLALLSKTPASEVAAWDKERHEYKYREETHAWSNGREQGFSLRVSSTILGNTLNFVCVEHRNSDSLMVYAWEGNESQMNPLTVADFTDDIYRNKSHCFDYLDIRRAFEFIRDQIQNFITAQYELAENNEQARNASNFPIKVQYFNTNETAIIADPRHLRLAQPFKVLETKVKE